MRLCILISLISLTGCDAFKPREVLVEVRPVIDQELLQPCSISSRKVATANELALLAIEHLGTARCANAKIAAISETLRDQNRAE
ncbi:Rz1-like lysis system protein LysC [Pacificibacter marinus]|uniref:Rz1-like lysis system protein LysC n=1 Tax=Pacificibacter marinus TaxID=658057 RepID=UPI003F541620